MYVGCCIKRRNLALNSAFLIFCMNYKGVNAFETPVRYLYFLIHTYNRRCIICMKNVVRVVGIGVTHLWIFKEFWCQKLVAVVLEILEEVSRTQFGRCKWRVNVHFGRKQSKFEFSLCNFACFGRGHAFVANLTSFSRT